jgi:hypothetical protein
VILSKIPLYVSAVIAACIINEVVVDLHINSVVKGNLVLFLCVSTTTPPYEPHVLMRLRVKNVQKLVTILNAITAKSFADIDM